MNKTYLKIIFKEIKSSFGRFAAIFGIVALSVGFLAGLLATTPDMKTTADEFYDNNNMSDIIIKGTMGLTDKDIYTLSSLYEVEKIMPAYVTDILLDTDREVITSRIFGIPLLNNSSEVGNINKLELLSGRMPENNNECLVEKSHGEIFEIELGTKLKISKENEDYEDIDDTYDVKEYTVVGIVSNPSYFSIESERSSVGNGRIGAIVYVDESAYALDVYTDFYIKVYGASKLTAFTDEYEDYIEKVTDKLEEVGKKQSEIRYSDIKNEAYSKLFDAKKEYEDGKLEADKELGDAYQEIEDGKIELADGLKELEDGKKELEDAKATLIKETQNAQKEIDDGYKKLADAKIELEDGEKEYQDGLKELEDGEKEYAEGLKELEDGKKEYEDGLKEFLEAEQELKDGQDEFDKGEQEYLDGVKELEDGKKEIEKGKRKLSSAKKQLEEAETEYELGLKEFTQQKSQFNDLMVQVLGAVNSVGLNFSSSDELIAALEHESYEPVTTGTSISGIVTGILGGMRAEIQNQIDYLTLINTGTESEIATIKMLQETLNSMPSNANELLYSWKAIKEGEATLNEAKSQINYGWSEYEKGKARLNKGKRKISEGENELEKAKLEIEENKIKLEDGWKELEEARIELEDGKKKLDEGFAEIEDARQKLDDAYVELVNGRKELDDGWEKYYDGIEELKEAEETLKNEIAKANNEILDGEKDLIQGQLDYEEGVRELGDGEKEYLDAKADVEKELNDALIKITDAEKEIEDIDKPKWYVLDRNSNVSYASFSNNVEKVADVTKVFPVFFFLIAALVTLTTMTRMVEEERTQIGTLKALGYKKGAIISKYIVYCGLASTLGSITGLIVGFRLLPVIIWNAYRSIYRLPDLSNVFLWQYALPVALASIISTLAVTIYVCYNSLKEKPSTLMLPRAPKVGKRIILENINFIWSRMTFTQKSTARNILRYKRHFFMTVIGIAGCTALVLVGFGLLDSIDSVANTQFIDLFQYDLTVQLEEEFNLDNDEILHDFLENQSEYYVKTYTESGYVINGKERLAANIYVPENSDEILKAVNLRDRKSLNKIIFDDNSVIASEKLADELGISVGEKLVIEDVDGNKAEFVLTGITENYVGIYVYINKSDFIEKYNNPLTFNTLLIKIKDEHMDSDEIIRNLLKSDNVMSAEHITQIKKSFDNLLNNINFIVIVLIIAAGGLAIIVLYNLTNININERRKELSTLKVLGYHNEEVAAYVFRETTILSILGTFVGLFLGVLLHAFVVKTVEAANLMLGRNISFLSYIYSAVITLFFSMLVNLIMYRKLKKIEMVESMKAID
ncbi:MAG: FtsX-like permease family protein [Tissierellia bacterium]|nr:FtsX-like permease family protein [Tissierellia bacterium]